MDLQEPQKIVWYEITWLSNHLTSKRCFQGGSSHELQYDKWITKRKGVWLDVKGFMLMIWLSICGWIAQQLQLLLRDKLRWLCHIDAHNNAEKMNLNQISSFFMQIFSAAWVWNLNCSRVQKFWSIRFQIWLWFF